MVLTPFLLVSGLFVCLAALSAVIARSAARDARQTVRELRADVRELQIQNERHTAQLRKIAGTIGGLSRGDLKRANVTDDGLPDPNINPEKWRAAVRLRGLQRKNSEERL